MAEQENLKAVHIHINSYHNINTQVPTYPYMMISNLCKCYDHELGMTDEILVTDQKVLRVDNDFVLYLNPQSESDLETLATPIILKFFLNNAPPDFDIDTVPMDDDESENVHQEEIHPSAISLYEAIVGKPVEKVIKKGAPPPAGAAAPPPAAKPPPPKPDTGKKGAPSARQFFGSCFVDLIPIVFGRKKYQEIIEIDLANSYNDERLVTYQNVPSVKVTISIDQPITYDCGISVLSLSVESIFNIPQVMSPDLEYKVCFNIPNGMTSKVPIVFSEYSYEEYPILDQNKRWFNLEDPEVINKSSYMLNTNVDDVKDRVGNIDIQNIFYKYDPRIQFNTIKRNILLPDGFYSFIDQIKLFRSIAIEIYCQPDYKGKPPPKPDFLQLMAIVDLTALLYPGVTSIRVAVPISTYQEVEIMKQCGYKSFLVPTVALSPSKPKPAGNQGLMAKLPPVPIAPPEPAPSRRVYNEVGEPTFIIIEIKLSNSIEAPRNVEDIQKDLKSLIHIKPQMPKTIMDKDIYKVVVRKIIQKTIEDLNKDYLRYDEEMKSCQCGSAIDFVSYMRKQPCYDRIVEAVNDAANYIIQCDLNYDMLRHKNLNHYLAGVIFIGLSEEIAQILRENKMIDNEEAIIHRPPDFTLMYAKEAASQQQDVLAQRYYLANISLKEDKERATSWFDYAIYFFETNEKDKAIKAIEETLSLNPNHKHSLIIHGILLMEKKKIHAAETCFLSVLIQEPTWVEAWGVLYIYYLKIELEEGMEVCNEKTIKYLDYAVNKDYFLEFDDLEWATEVLPNAPFLRLAAYLIKLRMLDWAEEALSLERRYTGHVHYLLAVICFYRQQYDHALDHLQSARSLIIADYSILSLFGHCYYNKGDYETAERKYKYVVQSMNRPNYIHLVHVNYALLLSYCENYQDARKIILISCKHLPSPYTWFLCGKFYYRLNDYIIAEECLSESVMYDTSFGDSWGYLVLVNLKLCHLDEAEICEKYAEKHGMMDLNLWKEIKNEFQLARAKEAEMKKIYKAK